MNLIRKHIIIIVSIIFCSEVNFTLSAQEKNTTDSYPDNNENSLSISNLTPGDYAKMVLPPLSYLLETAANSPKIGVLVATREAEEGNMKTVKRNWLNSFYVFGTYQYGQYFALNNETSTSGSGSSGTPSVYSTEAQSVYSTGAGVTIPLELFINRNNTIKIQQKKLKQIDYQIANAVNEQKMQIAELYSTAIQQLATLKIKAEIYTLANSQMKLTEVQYLNGDISLNQYNESKSAQASAIINYESTRAELNKAILFLELLTGVKIIKK